MTGTAAGAGLGSFIEAAATVAATFRSTITCVSRVGGRGGGKNGRTLLRGGLRCRQDDWSGWHDGRGLGVGNTETVVDLLDGISARRDEGGLAGVVALQDEHPAQVVV